MNVSVKAETWAYRTPFAIARGVQDALPVVQVTIERGGHVGRGEAAGVDYDGETVASMRGQIEAAAATLGEELDRNTLAETLGPGGARNALDCALWDLEAKTSGERAWRRAGLPALGPVTTACTIGLGDEAHVAGQAAALADWPLVKVKLDGDRHIDVVRIVRSHCPSSRLIVDPNQSWSLDLLNALSVDLARFGVVLIEQPLPRGQDVELAGYRGATPLAADESCVDRASLPQIASFYDVVNIKLDKAGGLTEALALADAARGRGLGVMVGCMAGTSLAMAPGTLVAQRASFVDLDGPLLHTADRDHAIRYDRGSMSPPEPILWG